MRLTKRQLRRIIKEEISKSRRRSIREARIGGHEMSMVGSMSHPSLNNPQSLSNEEFHTLKDLMDEYCSAATVQLIISCNSGSELEAKAFAQESNTMFEIQDIVADMREDFGMEPPATLDAMATFDRNILERILDDSM